MSGRFAPSPTGPLHLGSLLAATASYLEAHKRRTPWRLRFDDLDTPRCVPGAEDAIKRALETHGLLWDGPVQHQSAHLLAYEHALDPLADLGLLFYCTCSRRQLDNHEPYPGTCRSHSAPRPDAAIRVRVDDRPLRFDDAVQGSQTMVLSDTVGDFVVRRRDQLIAYQLATAVDDGAAEIDHVVRGADLLDNSPRQIYLMKLLGLSIPEYAHVPVLRFSDGSKLSKQTRAMAVASEHAASNLATTLARLGLSPPPDCVSWRCEEILLWAQTRWSLNSVDKTVPPISRN